MTETKSFSIGLGDAVFAGIEAGEGLAVVFLHADVADKRMWLGQLGPVAAAGYRAIAYDRRGFGDTSAPDEDFAHLDDLEDLLDALGVHAAILVGCSRGGALAIDFALSNPERTVGLVLVSTAVSGWPEPELPEEVLPMIDALEDAEDRGDLEAVNRIEAHAWLDGPLSPSGRVSGPVRELFLAMNGKALAHPFVEADEPEPAADDLEDVAAPVLLVAGSLDFPHVLERHADLAESFGNAFAVLLEGTAHLPSLERPDLFDPLLLEFLSAVAGGPEGADGEPGG